MVTWFAVSRVLVDLSSFWDTRCGLSWTGRSGIALKVG
jgi:hypothetical protein